MGYYSAYFVALGSLLAGAAAVHTFYKPNLVRCRATVPLVARPATATATAWTLRCDCLATCPLAAPCLQVIPLKENLAGAHQTDQTAQQ
jgi:hypothetical protein